MGTSYRLRGAFPYPFTRTFFSLELAQQSKKQGPKPVTTRDILRSAHHAKGFLPRNLVKGERERIRQGVTLQESLRLTARVSRNTNSCSSETASITNAPQAPREKNSSQEALLIRPFSLRVGSRDLVSSPVAPEATKRQGSLGFSESGAQQFLKTLKGYFAPLPPHSAKRFACFPFHS